MLDIKDRIIVQNKSPYCIQQMVVALPHGVQMEVFGTITYLDPDKIVELANYKRKSIETLKGKKLAIKLRGLKKVEGSFDDFTDPSLETYDFAIVVYEEEKDLYFEIVNRGDIKVDEEDVDTTYLFDKKKKS